MKWQPIETAPKDGTNIFVYIQDDHPALAYWYEIKGDDFNWKGWQYADELLQEVKPEGINPTYWMPLPPPPEQE